MRFVSIVLFAALLLAILGLLAGGIVDGYFGGSIFPDDLEPDSWSAPDSWSEWRDIMIVSMALFWMLAGLAALVLMIVLIFLAGVVRKLLRENAAPAIDSLKLTIDNVRGTAEFTGESVVSPIIRVYSIFSGVRSGVRAVTNLPGRVRGRKPKKRGGRW